MDFVRPQRLKTGDTVAVVSLSSGMAGELPARFAVGKRQLEESLDLKVVAAPNALRGSDWLYNNPRARADDLAWALTDSEIRGIVCAIGGNESVRILPFVDSGLIGEHPKIFIGFSDSTVQHVVYLNARVVSFYGPSLLTGFAENCGIDDFTLDAAKRVLFQPEPLGDLAPAPSWTEEYLDWTVPENQLKRRARTPNSGWIWLQAKEGGPASVSGHLIGGCMDVLEMLKGTRWWPDRDEWRGAILHLELSEVAPVPQLVEDWLRNYASQGIPGDLAGLLISRPTRYTSEMRRSLFDAVRKVLDEIERPDMPVVCDLDFGHTSPMGVLPLGCRAEINPGSRRITIIDSAVS